MPYWDERFAAIAKEYPQVKTSQFHVDILAAHLVRNPHWFDVIVGSNLFGDILSDLGPATTGTIAIAPGGNINPERDFPSMFEPVHGSAPDIAGKGIANPIGQIWSGAMMLEHLGHKEAADAIVKAIETPVCRHRRAHRRHGRQGHLRGAGRGDRRAGAPRLRASACMRLAGPAANPLNRRAARAQLGESSGAIPGMARRPTALLRAIAAALAICAGASPVCAQQWQTETDRTPPPSASTPVQIPGMRPTSPVFELPPNTTVVPRTAPGGASRRRAPPARRRTALARGPADPGRAEHRAGPRVARLSRQGPVPTASRGSSPPTARRAPTLRLEPGDYVVNVAFGRANLTRKITVSSERAVQERFVLNAGGLRLYAGARQRRGGQRAHASSTTSFPTSATSTASAPR